VKLYKNQTCSGTADATGTVTAFTGTGITVTVTGDQTTQLSARTADAAGNESSCSSSISYTEDSTAPSASVDSGPTGPTKNKRPIFGFSSIDGTATFQCSIDQGTASFGPCSGATTDQPASNLVDGHYTFRVQATDAAGNTSSPATRGFTVDTVAPNTTITAGPATGSFTKDTTPTFRFSSSEAGSSFKCKLDTGPYSSCTSPKTTTTLSDGVHTLYVRATDLAHNTDLTPATRRFTIDTHAPQTTITAGPVSGTTRDSTPTFKFRSTEAGTFACSLDHAAFAPCVSPHTTATLSLGNHTFDVRATDRAGNTDATRARAAFKVVP
jgi:hypothetical protein